MKEHYIEAEMDIIVLNGEDIIGTSSAYFPTKNPNCPQEGPEYDTWV